MITALAIIGGATVVVLALIGLFVVITGCIQ
jgi:hypothetical protein